MNTARWRQIESLFNQALEMDGIQRKAFLQEACGGDPELQKDIEELFAEESQVGSFLEKAALREFAHEFAASADTWIGSRIGNYEFGARIGAGGMGEVYRARDTKLKRDVAIKILPDEFLRDPDRVSRFQREAELLASLNHPNIAAIYDLEERNGSRFLILEFVEGETLAERIKRGPVPVEEALKISLQLAEAVEAAHEKNVIHRDLKPANIKLTGGKVKVLDFGLAKTHVVDVNLENSLSVTATQQGIILGTAAYMSPEQARGQPVDRRADVWAFGCILFEMLSGHGPFGGKTSSDVIAAVLKTEPDWNSLPAGTHPRILHLLERCLEKDPQDRSRGLSDARVEIRKVLANRGGVASPAAKAQTVRSRIPWIAAMTAVAVLASILGWTFRPTSPDAVQKLDFVLPEGQALFWYPVSILAVSKYGKRMAYVARDQLYLRNMDEREARPIPGTQGVQVTQPEFSPDEESLAYTTGSPGDNSYSLKKIAVSGGIPVTLIENGAKAILELNWTNDRILFSSREGIMEVSATVGGKPKNLIKASHGELLRSPELLPDGESVLFSAIGLDRNWSNAQIFVQPLKSGADRILVGKGSDPRYLATGHIVYMQGNTLFALPFDIDHLKPLGAPRTMVEGVQRSRSSDSGNYDISDTGTLVYIQGRTPVSVPNRALGLLNRNTGALRKLNVPPGQYHGPRLSPNKEQLAVEIVGNNGQSSIAIYDLKEDAGIRTLPQPLGRNTHAIWTPNGKNVTYASNSDGAWRIYSQTVDGNTPPIPLTTAETGVRQLPESWSPKSNTLSFTRESKSGDVSLWTFSMETGKSLLFHDTPGFNDFGSAFSLDGNYIAFTVQDDSKPGIRIQRFPPDGLSQFVTTMGEKWPVWSAPGELVYFRGNELVGARISTEGPLKVSSRPLLSVKGVRISPGQDSRGYDIVPDSENFVVMVPVSDPAAAAPPPATRINVVLSFFEELKARVPLP